MAIEIPKISELIEEVIEFNDEDRPRLMLDFSDAEDDLEARSNTNKGMSHKKQEVAENTKEQLDQLYNDIFKPPEMNMHVIATMITQMNPVEDIASSFGATRQELIDFVEESTKVKFIDFVARFQCKPRMELRRWQMESAERGNPQMLIWLGKQELGQQDKPKEANAPVIIIEKPDLGQLPQKPPEED